MSCGYTSLTGFSALYNPETPEHYLVPSFRQILNGFLHCCKTFRFFKALDADTANVRKKSGSGPEASQRACLQQGPCRLRPHCSHERRASASLWGGDTSSKRLTWSCDRRCVPSRVLSTLPCDSSLRILKPSESPCAPGLSRRMTSNNRSLHLYRMGVLSDQPVSHDRQQLRKQEVWGSKMRTRPQRTLPSPIAINVHIRRPVQREVP